MDATRARLRDRFLAGEVPWFRSLAEYERSVLVAWTFAGPALRLLDDLGRPISPDGLVAIMVGVAERRDGDDGGGPGSVVAADIADDEVWGHLWEAVLARHCGEGECANMRVLDRAGGRCALDLPDGGAAVEFYLRGAWMLDAAGLTEWSSRPITFFSGGPR